MGAGGAGLLEAGQDRVGCGTYALTVILLMRDTFSVTVFEVLAERNRRVILDLLRQRERVVGELVEAMGLSQPAVSKHLRVLREAGVVGSRVDGQRRVYRIRAGGLREVDDWLAPYRQMWASSLQDLEVHLDDMGVDDWRRDRIEGKEGDHVRNA